VSTDQPSKALAITADDVAVSLKVRDDLGAHSEPAVIAEFLDRVSDAIDERVDERVAQRLATPKETSLALPITSMALGIPLTAIASTEGMSGMLLCWAGIVLVNLAHALRRH
jgi:hypothetical protein